MCWRRAPIACRHAATVDGHARRQRAHRCPPRASVADVVVVASGGVIAPGEGAVADNAPRVVDDAGVVVPHAAARRRHEVVARRRRRGRRDRAVMGRSGATDRAQFHEHRLPPMTAT